MFFVQQAERNASQDEAASLYYERRRVLMPEITDSSVSCSGDQSLEFEARIDAISQETCTLLTSALSATFRKWPTRYLRVS